MTKINRSTDTAATLASYFVMNDEGGTSSSSFNDKVLAFFKQNQPDDSLKDVITKLKALAEPGEKISMQQLNSAILIADSTLRKDDGYKAYTDSTLDKMTTQMLGINMLYNNMLYKGFTKTDDDDTSL